MNKNKKSIGLYLTLVAGIIAIVEAVYYGKVMYTFQPVYLFPGSSNRPCGTFLCTGWFQ